MCSPISLIMSEDNCFFPTNDSWNHSHTDIATLNNLSTSLFGDKYARVEVVPENNIFRNNETNEAFEVDDSWDIVLDEERTPGFWENDRVNQENRAREYAKKWLKNFEKKYLIPGYREIGGDCSRLIGGDNSELTGGNYSTLTGGYESTLTGGNYSTLTGGNYSTLTGGDFSTLTGGYCSTLNGGNYSQLTGGNGSKLTGGDFSTLTGGDESILTGGNYSTLTGRNYSIFCAGENSSFVSTYWDVTRFRTIVFYVGENGILPDKKYQIANGKIYDFETGEEVKKTLKSKSKKERK